MCAIIIIIIYELIVYYLIYFRQTINAKLFFTFKVLPEVEEEIHDCAYFRKILANTIDLLEARCDTWEKEQQACGDSMTEIAHEQLLLATGMARLLIREKFAQFRGLIDNCENPASETTTLCTDLQGFWDMIYIQVKLNSLLL